MRKTNLAHPVAFRTEAVELVRTSGTSIPVIAWDLGVSEHALRDWVRRAEIDAGQGPAGALTSAERFEWIELFYNRHPLHSSLDYATPVEFEEKMQPMPIAASTLSVHKTGVSSRRGMSPARGVAASSPSPGRPKASQSTLLAM